MRKKKWIVVKDRNKMRMLKLVLTLFLFMGIGYSALSTKLSINGNLEVAEYLEPTLYNVLKKEANSGGLALKYTGEHHDSFTEGPSKEIYHWYANNDTEGEAVLDKNNVIFADHCWQMIRTTDTGGVKMIYNGEVEDGKCLNTRGEHVGYANLTSQNLNTSYYFGTSYTYDSSSKEFQLSGTKTTGEIKIGQYTCKATTSDATCSTLYYVDSLYTGTYYYVIALNSNSHYSLLGSIKYNNNNNSLGYVGYMYNTIYPYHSKMMTSYESMYTSQSLKTSYWYADSTEWGNPTSNTYNLINPYQVADTTDYPNLVGKYTFFNATQSYTNNTVWYIAAVNNTTAYVFQLSHDSVNPRHTLADFNYTYTYGDSYTDNNDGTYTINNPSTVERKDWYTSYSNVGAGKYVCRNAVNNTCSELWYTTATTNTNMTYINVTNNYKYAKSFTWDGSKYILDNDNSVTFFEWNSTNRTSLNNAHYTCWNDSGECTTISYIYYASGTTPYYINIDNGKDIEAAKNEMLYNNDVNQVNSNIKTAIDIWFEKELEVYYFNGNIEDTIFCDDRTQINASTNGWNPNGGNVSTYMRFKEYNPTTNLSCTNATDKFSLANPQAKLRYPVGLMSTSEMKLLNNSKIQGNGQSFWLTSPSFFGGNNISRSVVTATAITNGAYSSLGIRPAISLKSGIEYISGDGSMANPYVVVTDMDTGSDY